MLAGDVVATVIVLDDPYPMSLPPEPLPVTPFLAPITDEELAANGGLKRTIVMRVIPSTPGSVDPPFTGAATTPLVDPPPGELPDWVFQQYYPPDATPPKLSQIADKVYALGSAGNASSQNPGMPTTYIPVPVDEGDHADGGAERGGGVDDRQLQQHPPSVPHPREPDVHRGGERQAAGRAVLGGHGADAVQRQRRRRPGRTRPPR